MSGDTNIVRSVVLLSPTFVQVLGELALRSLNWPGLEAVRCFGDRNEGCQGSCVGMYSTNAANGENGDGQELKKGAKKGGEDASFVQEEKREVAEHRWTETTAGQKKRAERGSGRVDLQRVLAMLEGVVESSAGEGQAVLWFMLGVLRCAAPGQSNGHASLAEAAFQKVVQLAPPQVRSVMGREWLLQDGSCLFGMHG